MASARTTIRRILVAAAGGVVVFLGTMVGNCDAIGGVPTWERCDTWLGTPAFVDWPSGILDLIIPLALGASAALAAWWLLGLTQPRTSTQPPTSRTAERADQQIPDENVPNPE
jgi:hypothetical protein